MDYKAFMKENVVEVQNEKYVATKRILDENNEPMEWELRSISAKEDEEILKSCLTMGARGLEVDRIKCLDRVIASSVVFPDLNNVELQDSYGVKSSEQLLRVMLTAKEYYQLQRQVCLLGNNVQSGKKVSPIKESSETTEITAYVDEFGDDDGEEEFVLPQMENFMAE